MTQAFGLYSPTLYLFVSDWSFSELHSQRQSQAYTPVTQVSEQWNCNVTRFSERGREAAPHVSGVTVYHLDTFSTD